MKAAYIDVETTGLSPYQHSLWQFSGIFFVKGQKYEYDFHCRPTSGAKVDPKALEIAGIPEEDLQNFPDPSDEYGKFKKFLNRHIDPYDKRDKFHFIAYNAAFDSRFVRAFFEAAGDKFYGSYFWHPPVDIMAVAAWELRAERNQLSDFKLGTVATHLGIEIDEERLHDASYDIELTVELANKLASRKDG